MDHSAKILQLKDKLYRAIDDGKDPQSIVQISSELDECLIEETRRNLPPDNSTPKKHAQG